MKNKKTVGYLNTKIWYRAVKVFFALGFIVSILFVNVKFVLSENTFTGVYLNFPNDLRDINENKTLIECSDGKTFTPASIDVNLNYEYFNTLLFNNNVFVSASLRSTDLSYWDYLANKSELDRIVDECNGADSYVQTQTGIRSLNNREDSSVVFTLKPVFSYWRSLGDFFVANLVVILVFWLISRIFYYVTLGSLFPKR